MDNLAHYLRPPYKYHYVNRGTAFFIYIGNEFRLEYIGFQTHWGELVASSRNGQYSVSFLDDPRTPHCFMRGGLEWR